MPVMDSSETIQPQGLLGKKSERNNFLGSNCPLTTFTLATYNCVN